MNNSEKEIFERLVAIETSLSDFRVYIDERFLALINLIKTYEGLGKLHSDQIIKINERCGIQKLECFDKYNHTEVGRLKLYNNRLLQLLIIVTTTFTSFVIGVITKFILK